MNGSLNRVSLVIEFDEPHRRPDPRHVLDPAGFESEIARVMLHEATHYWQQLSQTYLLLVAAEEWTRLKQFRATGQVPEAGPLAADLRTPDAGTGFSPRDLSECACRYWDIVNIGPHNLVEAELAKGTELTPETRASHEAAVQSGLFRLSDDGYTQDTIAVAMQVVGGAYARPYLHLQDKLGSGAMVLFPLLAHWALQTPAPVALFSTFAERAAAELGRWLKRSSLLRRVTGRHLLPTEMRDLQLTMYRQLGGPIYTVAKEAGYPLWTAGQYFQFTPLADHPVYSWAAHWTRQLGKHLVDNKMARDMRRGFRRDPDSLAILAADRLLALPGGGLARDLLYRYLTPPVHRFTDDLTWFTKVGPTAADNAAITRTCMEIHTSWERFRTAARGY
jgi:hypothetical protein